MGFSLRSSVHNKSSFGTEWGFVILIKNAAHLLRNVLKGLAQVISDKKHREREVMSACACACVHAWECKCTVCV